MSHHTRLLFALLCLSLTLAALSIASARAQNTSNAPPQSANAPTAEQKPTQSSQPGWITKYTLPPDRNQKARALAKVTLRERLVDMVYGFILLLVVLWWKLAPKYRDIAERVSSRRFVQVLVFASLIALTLDILSLPTRLYAHFISVAYGLSVQGWFSWFWDWTKGELLSVIFSIIIVAILYSVIRQSPRRWWFYFWLATLPLILAIIFISPLVIDPMFHKFEPLQQKDPALTVELERMVQRGGEDIPPSRMFWMGAAEKTTQLNAYVTGFGSSKRIVVWDTTIAKLNTPQIVFVAGHEMGHYVLHHIPQGFAFGAAMLFIAFYLGYRFVDWVLAHWGAQWGIRSLEDFASYPALLLVISILATLGDPIGNAFSRYIEHQADQYGLEVTHGLTPHSGEVAAQSFNILGEIGLDDPDPSRLRVLLFYDHPSIPDRIQFALHYNPWAEGKTGQFVK